MKPRKSILDPTFRYVPEAETDIRATFRRIKREQKAQSEAERLAEIERRSKVRDVVFGKGRT